MWLEPKIRHKDTGVKTSTVTLPYIIQGSGTVLCAGPDGTVPVPSNDGEGTKCDY